MLVCRHLNLVHNLPPYLILASEFRSFKWAFSIQFSGVNFVCISHLVIHATCTFHVIPPKSDNCDVLRRVARYEVPRCALLRCALQEDARYNCISEVNCDTVEL